MIYEDYNSINSVEVYMLKGEKGAKGDQGPVGPQGDAGLAGASASSIGQGYGVCSTSSETSAKTVTISGISSIFVGMLVSIKFTNAVLTNATLAIGSTDPKPIYHRGLPLSSAAVIGAGDTVTFMYDGTAYNIIAIEPGAVRDATSASFWRYRRGGSSQNAVQECWTWQPREVPIQTNATSVDVSFSFPFSFSSGRPNVFVSLYSSMGRSGNYSYLLKSISSAGVVVQITRPANLQSDVFYVFLRAEC